MCSTQPFGSADGRTEFALREFSGLSGLRIHGASAAGLSAGFFKKSECAHSAAPPIPNATAALSCAGDPRACGRAPVPNPLLPRRRSTAAGAIPYRTFVLSAVYKILLFGQRVKDLRGKIPRFFLRKGPLMGPFPFASPWQSCTGPGGKACRAAKFFIVG